MLKQQNLFFWIFTILIIFVLFLGLSIDVTRDAAKYAYISKEISQTGEWLNLQINGEQYFQKPPFLFWLSAIFFKLFGISNFTFKLPILLYSFLGFFAVYMLSKSIYGKNVAKMSSLIISSSVISVLYNMDIHTDTVLMANVAFSLWFLYEYLKKNKIIYFIGSSIFLGLCILTKGPFGVVVPFFAVLGYLISKRDFKSLFSPKWILLIVISLIVALPSYLPAFIENGFKGVLFFFWENNFRRITGDYNGTIPDPTFYIHTLLYLVIPWIVIIAAGVYYQFKNIFKKNFKPVDHFIFWGIWIVFLILSISKNKLPNYLMPLMPFFSILAAKTWFNLKENAKVWIHISYYSLFVYWILIIFILAFFVKSINIFCWIIIAITFITTFFLIQSDQKNIKIFYSTMSTAIVLGLVLNLAVFPKFLNLQGAPQAARVINKTVKENEKIFYFNPDDIEYKKKLSANNDFGKVLSEDHFFLNYELMFYSNKPVFYINDIIQLNQVVKSGYSWIYTNENGKNEILNNKSIKTEILTFDNFDLRKPLKYVNPRTMERSMCKAYLFHFEKQ